ncbi:GDSL esterase/lipase At5g03610-like isoform X1 [Juglans regia]|uniref:GDSL esterase/lipase At5g03610-like isoform X1 n=2 Tax=Juglans regia TaxID=51240 RepID=A0A2I4DKR9_JUGRE|nr:GDSL esterase/lipase At5g03610-like isoform X1 [Juglans regia]
MDTPTLLYYVLYCFIFFLLSGQQLVQGRRSAHHHHHHHRKHHHHISANFHRPPKLFVFGDSYADTGNRNSQSNSWNYPYGITFPGKPAGRFSDGRVLTDYVAEFMGVKSPFPYRRRHLVVKNLKNGMNFAYGGTGVFDTLFSGPNMTTQIDFFQQLLRDHVFTANDIGSSVALVTVAGNDYTTYKSKTNGSSQGLPSYITTVIKQVMINLKRIRGLGVKKVAVTTLEPVGCLPAITAVSSFQRCNETENLFVRSHNLLLHQAVAKLNNETKGSDFAVLDLYASFMSILKNKAGRNLDCAGSIKFENPMKPCCTGISREYSCGDEDKDGAKKYTVCGNPNSTFFWDNVHPSQVGWRAVSSALHPTLEQLIY